jgi:hypothetical protein
MFVAKLNKTIQLFLYLKRCVKISPKQEKNFKNVNSRIPKRQKTFNRLDIETGICSIFRRYLKAE